MTILKRKYPFEPSRHWLADCLVNCAIVFALLYLLQPFGFSLYTGSKLLASLGFAAVTLACCVVAGGVLFRLWPRRVATWRIWHQAVSIILLVLSIGVANCIYAAWLYGAPLTSGLLLTFVYWSFIVGVFITVVSVGISYNRHLRRRVAALPDGAENPVTVQDAELKQEEQQVTFHDQAVRGDDLTIAVGDFLYAEALKNNVAICYMDGDRVVRHEMRQTLTALLDGAGCDCIMQCHRSFVVNVNNITSAQGNSNGYRLTLGECPTPVPVSRTYVPRLRPFFR